jgi:hypothetical protein
MIIAVPVGIVTSPQLVGAVVSRSSSGVVGQSRTDSNTAARNRGRLCGWVRLRSAISCRARASSSGWAVSSASARIVTAPAGS